ncbi:PDZ domain-containing protein [Mycolicibacter minnesotensis]|uniref:endopeptidase La n=1 Tax=Mycolicibacter minnesotensis TaxID=1118379 RepID=A0A7I7R340_9MYCO|nr:PDZ domain-containing protein [Mycolicibacter minnesotensis]ORA98282.1 PDZ domain-containing protein [Mycolicibacter minnesotensis]BBY32546.1 signal protein PDZ [Mycolicibacter minnesotensis]
MNRRILTLLAALLPVVAFGVLLTAVTVPFVSLGPGPTFDTLGMIEGKQVVDIEGTSTHPTTGHLNMTTVAQRDGLTLGEALALWLSGREQLMPRDLVYPPGKSRQEVDDNNDAEFRASERSAEYAALGYLRYPSAVTLADVQDPGPSAGALQRGDAVDAVNGEPVYTVQQFTARLADTKPGQTVVLDYRRKNAAPGTARITLGENKDRPNGFLGVSVLDAPWAPFTVDFNLANIGGPSAGLMFSLAVVDKLTTGTLAGQNFVAGTGVIKANGEVDSIGGITHKMVAAREAGATVFLVPADNCYEARSDDKGLQLVKVDSLAQAVGALRTIADGGQPPSC